MRRRRRTEIAPGSPSITELDIQSVPYDGGLVKFAGAQRGIARAQHGPRCRWATAAVAGSERPVLIVITLGATADWNLGARHDGLTGDQSYGTPSVVADSAILTTVRWAIRRSYSRHVKSPVPTPDATL